MVFINTGTPIRASMLADGGRLPRDIPYRELVKLERVLGETTWVNTNVLFIWQPEWHWDVRLYWHELSHEFLGWYINIQDPMRRTADGFFTTDHLLDVTVEPDRKWSFKDEAELSDAVELGMYTPEQRSLIHKWAREAVELVEAWRWPFESDHRLFRPESE